MRSVLSYTFSIVTIWRV